eukprot:symbB.v1.2.010134.t1/scaffold618.1/size180184/11
MMRSSSKLRSELKDHRSSLWRLIAGEQKCHESCVKRSCWMQVLVVQKQDSQHRGPRLPAGECGHRDCGFKRSLVTHLRAGQREDSQCRGPPLLAGELRHHGCGLILSTKAGQSIHKTAFASWRVETSRLRHHQQLLDSVSGWIQAEQSSGLVLWTFKEWQQMRPGDGQVEEAVAHNIENNQERMADCFFLWQSAMTRRLQMELRGARALEECWRQSATTLSVFRGWHHFARRSARIKVSLSASIFAFQRLVLGAWKLLVSRPGKVNCSEGLPFS